MCIQLPWFILIVGLALPAVDEQCVYSLSGVWRFGNCDDARYMMCEKEAGIAGLKMSKF